MVGIKINHHYLDDLGSLLGVAPVKGSSCPRRVDLNFKDKHNHIKITIFNIGWKQTHNIWSQQFYLN